MTDQENNAALIQAERRLLLLTDSIGGLRNSIILAVGGIRSTIEHELRQITLDLPIPAAIKSIVSTITRLPSSAALGPLVELGISLEQQEAEATALRNEIALRMALRGRIGGSA